MIRADEARTLAENYKPNLKHLDEIMAEISRKVTFSAKSGDLYRDLQVEATECECFLIREALLASGYLVGFKYNAEESCGYFDVRWNSYEGI